MKTFTLKLEQVKEFEPNPYRKHIGIIVIAISIFVSAAVIILSLYYGVLWYSLALLITLPELYKMAKNNYKNEINSLGECTLEFGENNVLCKYKNKITWNIPLKQISHIETVYFGTGKWFFPRTKETLIYTNFGNNDSYSLSGSINQQDQSIIQKEIELIKNTGTH